MWKLLGVLLKFRHGHIPCLWNLAQGTGQLIWLTNINEEQIRIGLQQKIEASGIEVQHLSPRRRLCGPRRNPSQAKC